MRGYCKLKEEALDYTLWRICPHRGYGPVIRQTTEWVMWDMRFFHLLTPPSSMSFIHLVVCLTTGPKPLPKQALHIVRSKASSFKWERKLWIAHFLYTLLYHMHIPYYNKVYKFWSQTFCVSLAHPALVLHHFAFMALANLHLFLMFVDPCIIVQFRKKNPTRCNNVSKFYYSIFIWNSTRFGWHRPSSGA